MLPAEPVSKKIHLIAACAFAAAAAALRFYHLDGQSIWNDEMFSIEVARRSFAEIQPLLVGHFHHPPMYFYLLHGVFSLLGESVWTLRLLSALFGSLTVGALYLIVAPRWGWKGGCVAALLCLFSPFHLAYSQEGRPYALAAFLALMSAHFFLRMLEGKRKGAVIGYVASTAALLYTHHWGLFLWAAQGMILLYVVLQKKDALPLVAAAIVMLLYLPGIPALLHQAAPSGQGEFWWAETPSFNELAGLTGAFSGTYFNMGSSTFASATALQIIGGACVLILLILALLRVVFQRDDESFISAVLLTGGVLAIPFFLSYIRPEVFLWYRYTVIALPLACAAAGALAFMRRPRSIAPLCAAVLIILGAAGSAQYYSWSKSNIKAVASYLSELTEHRREILIRPSYIAQMINYYYAGDAVQLDEAYLNTPLGDIVDTACSFVYVSLDMPNPIRDYMDSHFDKTAEKVFPGIAHMGLIVGEYRQKPDPEEEEEEERR